MNAGANQEEDANTSRYARKRNLDAHTDPVAFALSCCSSQKPYLGTVSVLFVAAGRLLRENS